MNRRAFLQSIGAVSIAAAVPAPVINAIALPPSVRAGEWVIVERFPFDAFNGMTMEVEMLNGMIAKLQPIVFWASDCVEFLHVDRRAPMIEQVTYRYFRDAILWLGRDVRNVRTVNHYENMWNEEFIARHFKFVNKLPWERLPDGQV